MVEDVIKNGVKHVTPAQAHALILEDKEIIILDVRTPKEFKTDRIEGAININYFSFFFKWRLKKLDPNKAYLVHCAVGGRSFKSLLTLKEAGLKNIIHMDEGLNGWREDKLPLA